MKEEKFIKKVRFYLNKYNELSPIEYTVTFGIPIDDEIEVYIQTKEKDSLNKNSFTTYIEFNNKIAEITKHWKHKYKTAGILDGQEWLLSIRYTDNKSTYFAGDIKEPENFNDLLYYIANYCDKYL